jgi:predicted metal-dependent hydrolase
MYASAYEHGLALFDQGRFFEAHEALEDEWRACTGPEKKFLQGLIQVAAALHHHANGNHAGTLSLLGRAVANLKPYPESFAGLDLAALLRAVEKWREALASGRPVPPAPKFKRLR